MTDEELIADAHKLGRWGQHRFMLLVGSSIVIALVLVSISMKLYTSSGAAQLDLSRPGYVSVRDQAAQSNKFEGFSASGEIDKKTLKEFQEMYNTHAEQATAVDSFGGEVMSDTALSIDRP